METGFRVRRHTSGSEGRPYRSHLHPACFSCRKRKSRCKTRETSSECIMCQVHGTDCVFPQIDEKLQRRSANSSRRLSSSARAMQTRRLAQSKQMQMPLDPTFPSSSPQAAPRQLLLDPGDTTHTQIELDSQINNGPLVEHLEPPPPPSSSFHDNDNENNRQESLSNLMGISAETRADNCHIVSPAIADDNDVLENYLSTIPNAKGRWRMIRKISSSNSDPASRPVRPVLFNTVQRHPLGVTTNQSLAATKCEIIEKLIEPHVNDLLDIFFLKANICFPIFDEASFKNTYTNNKQKISPALLSNLYANALIYWESSPKLRTSRCPDIRFIWVQASEALNSELFLSPGVSTVIAIILNVCGRPSTSIFGNGGLIGTAVALSSALGLNRDPSHWDISLSEKRFRIRIWWLVIVHERWCSLAYGTPLQIHRAQYDVPIPTIEDLCDPSTTSSQVEATSVFIALVTLTELLSHYLEHVYRVPKKNPPCSPETSTTDLELLLSEWEESLPDNVRRLVIRGVNLDIPGAANFRLAYLAVKLLLRRIQLDLDQGGSRTDENTASKYFTQAQRAAEDIVHLAQELDEYHFHGFWIPVNAFSLTSATTFLLRSALGSKHSDSDRNVPLQIAKDMITTLQSHCRNFSWDLADNCLANCGDTLEKIEAGNNALSPPVFPDFQEYMNIDASVLDELFPASSFGV